MDPLKVCWHTWDGDEPLRVPNVHRCFKHLTNGTHEGPHACRCGRTLEKENTTA